MKAITNYRYYLICATALICGIAMAAEPTQGNWLAVFLFTKAIGFAAGYATYRLIKYYDAKGEIPELSNLKAEEK